MIEQNSDSSNSRSLVHFRIAGHLIGINWPRHLDIREGLPTFVGFLEAEPVEGEVIMWVEIRTGSIETDQEKRQDLADKRLLSDISIQWGDRFRFEESHSAYITSVQSERSDRVWTMYSSKEFKRSTIYVVEPELSENSVLSWLLMVGFGQAVLPHKTMLIHASVIERGADGFAFLGKSGTGKSTHSRLWLKHIEGSRLLNDDNPVVKIDSAGAVWIYGSPWSGKTHCYRNQAVKLRGLIRLKQAGFNRWTGEKAKAALVSVLPSCTSIRWNKALFSSMVDTVEEIVAKVPVALLECLPNEDAAFLCLTELNKTNRKITNNQTT